MRRLNRHEYANTIADLTNVAADIEMLPADDSGYGFDNIGDVLTLSPTHLDAYYNSAQNVLDKVYGQAHVQKINIDPSQLQGIDPNAWITFSAQGTGTAEHQIKAGKYKATFMLFGTQGGNEPVKARISLGSESREVNVPNTEPKPFVIEAKVPDGPLKLSVSFINDFWNEQTNADRNLGVDMITIEGPLDAPASFNSRVFPERGNNSSDDAYASKVLRQFLSRAFRRPATNAEI